MSNTKKDRALKPADKPKKEVWYCWKEFATDGDPPNEPSRLLTPWADPHEHEEPYDYLFETPTEAKKHKKEFAPEEDWVLVKMTLEPV